jgi:hypothetical protein
MVTTPPASEGRFRVLLRLHAGAGADLPLKDETTDEKGMIAISYSPSANSRRATASLCSRSLAPKIRVIFSFRA